MSLTEQDKQEYYTFMELIRRIGKQDESRLERTRKWIQKNLIDKNITFKSSIGNGKSLKQIIDDNSNYKQFKKTYLDLDSILGTNVISDDIYIKCNPSDDRGNIITPEDNVFDKIDNRNNILNDLSESLNLNTPTGNIGVQVLGALALFFLTFSFGEYLFIKYPKKVINDA